MAALTPKGAAPGYPQLEVPDDQVEFWTERGYVVQSAPAKKPAKAKKK